MLDNISYNDVNLLKFEAIKSLVPKAKFILPNGGEIDWQSETWNPVDD